MIGESLGPYPVTVGRMAVTQIWVPESTLERARELMLETEIEHALGTEVRGGTIANTETLPIRVVALALAGVLAWAVLRAVLWVF